MSKAVETQRKVLLFAAKILVRFGDVYLPIFERAEREYKEALNRKSAIERARRIVREGVPEDYRD
ncbi:hypothetical protein [Mesorhizobium sp. KR1-2]|uniref:hypothetical protein n=1 Tax=Mesorhizobium sp. KR1-2 TaxID=3156609 RepID=UPI0032B51020